MATMDAIQFGKTRQELVSAIASFVEQYVKDAGVEVIRHHCGLAGTVQPHTLQGHDMACEFVLRDPEIPDHTQFVGIRIRHVNWQPVITIWGDRSAMEDFTCASLTEAVKNKLMDCIDKTITQA